jgi:hypothetical protein
LRAIEVRICAFFAAASVVDAAGGFRGQALDCWIAYRLVMVLALMATWGAMSGNGVGFWL